MKTQVCEVAYTVLRFFVLRRSIVITFHLYNLPLPLSRFHSYNPLSFHKLVQTR